MSTLRTSYEFTLPRGYIDQHGRVHREGVMRLATARDELEPLRDPIIAGPDDPRLTILVLARVVTKLGDVELITTHEIENLFAVDLAYLQDFYGVINFGAQEEYDALVRSQRETLLVGEQPPAAPEPVVEAEVTSTESVVEPDPARPSLRSAIEELPRQAL